MVADIFTRSQLKILKGELYMRREGRERRNEPVSKDLLMKSLPYLVCLYKCLLRDGDKYILPKE